MYVNLQRRPRLLRGLGLAPAPRTLFTNQGAPLRPQPPLVFARSQVNNSQATPVATASGSTATQVTGTPVPVGYSINSPFIASDGSQWEYSTAQGVWINVGTPYNLAAPSAATPPAATPATPYASTAAQVSGTPVPVGYPTNSAYYDFYGNTWQFSPTYGVWTETALAAPSTALATTSSVVPAGTSTAAPYTDANGNTWSYENGQWVETAAASSYSTILSWFTQQTLITGVPNWIIAAGLGFVALKLSQAGGRR